MNNQAVEKTVEKKTLLKHIKQLSSYEDFALYNMSFIIPLTFISTIGGFLFG